MRQAWSGGHQQRDDFIVPDGVRATRQARAGNPCDHWPGRCVTPSDHRTVRRCYRGAHHRVHGGCRSAQLPRSRNATGAAHVRDGVQPQRLFDKKPRVEVHATTAEVFGGVVGHFDGCGRHQGAGKRGGRRAGERNSRCARPGNRAGRCRRCRAGGCSCRRTSSGDGANRCSCPCACRRRHSRTGCNQRAGSGGCSCARRCRSSKA